MAGRRAQAYRSNELSELARQMLYAPPDKRAEVVRQAEQWHDELDASKNYPIDFVVYRLTGRRVPPSESVMLVGEVLRPDLRRLIDALSRSIALPPNPDDPGETTAELAERLGVSTKTIGRWREAGLRWRWVVREVGGKPTIVIMRAALAAFESQQSGRVTSATQFTRLNQSEKQRLIDRARRLADATEIAPQAIIDHLAKRIGRSSETVRAHLAEHDRQNPGNAVFADRAGPLTEKQKRMIDRAYRSGVGVARMCTRFRKTRSTIYRAIHEMRARRALALQISAFASPNFERPDADEVILRPIRRTGRPRRLDSAVIAHLPEPLRAAYDRPIDPAPLSRSLIVRYNYLKHQAQQARGTIKADAARAADLDRFDALLRRAAKTRGEIVAGLLPVVLSVVRRQLPAGAPDASPVFLQMLSRGNAVLVEEIERFDPSLSHKPESVLTNRLLRELVKPHDQHTPIDVENVLDWMIAVGALQTSEQVD